MKPIRQQEADQHWPRPIPRLAVWIFVIVLIAPSGRAEGLETQAWANFIMGRFHGEKTYLELDLERKVLASGGPKWRNLDATGLVEYYPNSWVDLTGEVTLGTTSQNDDIRSNELTLRLGVRTYFAEHLRSRLGRERKPLGRISVASLFRLEQRNFWYSDDTPSQTSYRGRVRLELKTGLSGPDPTADRTWYLLADVEGYFDLGEGVDERFAQKARSRLGLGYVFDARHRLDLIYILDRARDTIEQSPTETSQAFALRYRLTF